MKRSMTLLGISLVLAMCWSSPTVRAFCGFYVAKADAKLFNRASQVVLVRHEDPHAGHRRLCMANLPDRHVN